MAVSWLDLTLFINIFKISSIRTPKLTLGQNTPKMCPWHAIGQYQKGVLLDLKTNGKRVKFRFI